MAMAMGQPMKPHSNFWFKVSSGSVVDEGM